MTLRPQDQSTSFPSVSISKDLANTAWKSLKEKLSIGRKQKRRCRVPVYPQGYKYGYEESPGGRPSFERVDYFEVLYYYWQKHFWRGAQVYGSDKYRSKDNHEREITRQLPLWHGNQAYQSLNLQVALEDAQSALDPLNASLTDPQHQSKFFSLPLELRHMIYEKCFMKIQVFSPLKYKTRDETRLARRPSQLGPLLACRRTYEEAHFILLRELLQHLTLASQSALFLPWAMPMHNLAFIRHLTIHMFFKMLPCEYIGYSRDAVRSLPPRLPRQMWYVHTWLGSWDLIANRMPHLERLHFWGYPLIMYGPHLNNFPAAELLMLRPLVWAHGPAYQGDSAATAAAITTTMTMAMTRTTTAATTRSKTESDTTPPRPPSRLRELHLTLHWPRHDDHHNHHHGGTPALPPLPSSCLVDPVQAMLAAPGCDVRVTRAPALNSRAANVGIYRINPFMWDAAVNDAGRRYDPSVLRSNRGR